MAHEMRIQTQTIVENGGATARFEGHPDIALAGMGAISESPQAWSPPHLLLAAAESCIYLTMKAAAEKMRVQIASYASSAEGVLGSPDGRHTEFTAITVRVAMRMADPAQEARVEQLLKVAEEHCYVGRSLKVPVRIERE